MQAFGFFVLFGFASLVLFSPVFILKAMKRKRYIKKVENMSPQQRQLEMIKLQALLGSFNTSHILHFLLSVICVGMWIVPWILISISNRSQRSAVEKLMTTVVEKAA